MGLTGSTGPAGPSDDHWVATRIVGAPDSDPTFPTRPTDANLFSAVSSVEALILAGTIPGAVIYLLEGTFDTALGNPDVNGTILLNQPDITFIGAGAASVIANSKGGTLFKATQPRSGIRQTRMTGVSGQTAVNIDGGANNFHFIENLLEGFGSPGDFGVPSIDITSTFGGTIDHAIIQDCTITAALTGGVGIRYSGTSDLLILGNSFIGCVPGIKDSTAANFSIDNVRISNNLFSQGSGTLGNGIELFEGTGLQVSDNDFSHVLNGVILSPLQSFGPLISRVKITGNRIEHYAVAGIAMHGIGGTLSEFKIDSNVIVRADGTGTTGIELTFGSNFSVTGNILNGFNPAIDVGVPVVGIAGILMQDCDHGAVSENSIVNMPGPQILLRNDPIGQQIQENRHLVLTGNTCSHPNLAQFGLEGPQDGIAIHDSASNITISGNEVSTTKIGILLGDTTLPADDVSRIVVGDNVAALCSVAGIQGGRSSDLGPQVVTVNCNITCQSINGVVRTAGTAWIVMGNFGGSFHDGGVAFEVFLGNLFCDGSPAGEAP